MAQYNLTDLIYEDVNDEYGWGKYGSIQVLIRKKDGYINASKMCKDGGKDWFNWGKNETAKKIIEEFESDLHMSRSLLMDTYMGDYNFRGTYVNPKLVPHIAIWISAKFAVRVSEIVNNFIVREYQQEISHKQDRIDELLIGMDHVIKQNEELHKKLDSANKKLDLANENIIEAVMGVNQANKNIRGVQNKLDDTADHMVPPTHIQKKDAETYAIYFCTRDNNKATYIQCRARPFHLTRRENELRLKYPQFRKVICFNPVPNARTLASEFERRIQELGAVFSLKHQMICIPTDSLLSEQQMVDISAEVFGERKDPAEEAREEYPPVGMVINEEGKIGCVEEEEKQPVHQEEEPTHQEKVRELLKLKLSELKEIARAFPRSKEHGGWSGKNKSELVEWILVRRS